MIGKAEVQAEIRSWSIFSVEVDGCTSGGEGVR